MGLCHPTQTCVHSGRTSGQTHCSTLQHTAAHCNTLQHTATHCNTLQHTATRCNTLQTNICLYAVIHQKKIASSIPFAGLLVGLKLAGLSPAICPVKSPSTKVPCKSSNSPIPFSSLRSVLQCAAVCCSVLQCVAV